MGKPRIFKRDGRWIVADEVVHFPSTGAFMYHLAGEGESIEKAWRAAYGPTPLQRLLTFPFRALISPVRRVE